mgnify:CR=1 FL=1
MRYLFVPNDFPAKKFNLSWKAEKGKSSLYIKVNIDCGWKSPRLKEKVDQTGYKGHPKSYRDKLAVKGPLSGASTEGFWLPEKVWNSLKEYEEEAIIDIEGYLRWKEKKGTKAEKKEQTAKQRFRSKAKLVKTGTYTEEIDGTKIPGINFKIEFEPITEPTIADWFTDIGSDLTDFKVYEFLLGSVKIDISAYNADAEWRATFTDALPKSHAVSPEAKNLLTGDEPVTGKWYVIIGDGVYFCKTRSEDTAVWAIETFKERYPDIAWTMRLGSEKELGKLPDKKCSEAVREAKEIKEEQTGFITLAEDPLYGRLMYNPETESYIFYDYQKMQTRIPTEMDFLNLGIANSSRWMEDLDTVCKTCKENKEKAGLSNDEIFEILKAAAKKLIIPGTPAYLFYTSFPGVFGLAREGINKLQEAGVIETKEISFPSWDSKDVAMTLLENSAYALAATGFTGVWSNIGRKLGNAKDALLTILWIGGFTPFIAEEATQAAGMAIFIARQVKDPDLLRDAINRYEQIVTTGKELTNKFGGLNPFTYDAFKLFFQAAQDSLEIYRKLPDKIKEENKEREDEKKAWETYREERKKFSEDFKKYWEERKKQQEDFMDYWEERKRSWEAFMERDVEKTLSIMINTVTDSLRAVYFGMRTGVETIKLLKKLLREVTEETTRAKIEKMIEEAQKRIQDISANYDEIVQRGLEYASQVQDETARASYESYLLTLREQIEMELMRAEAEEIPIVEGIFRKGYLYVMGYPRYCRIFLNGEDTGKLTPERFVLDPGKYVIKVVKETGEEWEKEVEVKEGETTEVFYWIKKKAG